MLNHMTERWAYLRSSLRFKKNIQLSLTPRRVRESPGFDEDNTDSKEVLEDVVLRVTAREYLDTLRAVLTSGGAQPGQGEESLESGGADKVAYIGGRKVDGVGDDGIDVQAVTGLGDAVLASPALSHPLTLTILAGLAWPDSPSSTKV